MRLAGIIKVGKKKLQDFFEWCCEFCNSAARKPFANITYPCSGYNIVKDILKHVCILKVPMTRIFFIILFARAFKMMKNGFYFILIPLLVAELFKILIYANKIFKKFRIIGTLTMFVLNHVRSVQPLFLFLTRQCFLQGNKTDPRLPSYILHIMPFIIKSNQFVDENC